MLRQAYSTLLLKSIDDEQRIIEGVASSPSIDLDGDVLDPEGAQFSLPMPLLFLHSQSEPIGHVLSAHVSKSGIRIRAQIAKGVTPRIDEVWALIKGGLVRGLSIGSKVVAYTRNASTGGLNISKWRWLETSVVTIPANMQATITTVKSASLAVSGTGAPRLAAITPGVSGSPTSRAMNIAEQLTANRAQMTEKSARLQELVSQSQTESGLTQDDATERDTLVKDVRDLAKSIDTLGALELAMGSQAQPLAIVGRQPEKKQPQVQVVELEKGIRFARVAMAVAAGRGSISDTLEYAKRWNGQTPEVSKFIKQMYSKAVEGTSVVESPGWGGELVYTNNVQGELIELLRPATIMGRVQGFRQGVFNTRMAIQTGGSTVNWVGEGAAKPVTELAFDEVTLPYHKMAGIVVLTEELVRLSTPNAETVVRNDLVQQIARFMDAQFVTPSVTAGASNPASITAGVASPSATGTDADALYFDMNLALATFDNVENADNLTILMTPALARGISTLRNSLGTMEFTALNAKGGTLMGYPVLVSGSVPSGTIIIFNPADILVADDGRVTLDASNQATLDMAGGNTPTLNLWQRNMIGIRAERWVTYKKVRDESVAIIDTASYGPASS